MTTTTKPGGHAVAGAGHPAPKRLATPTDLKPAEARAIVEAINPLVAGAFALYIKTKNYHWHISGPHFRDYHLLFEEQAEQIFDSIDVMAERVRRIGGTTIRSLSHVQKLSPVQDDNDDEVAPHEMLRRLLEDNQTVAHAMRNAITVCDQNHDLVTSNALEELLDQTEKRVWFLYEAMQSA